MSTPPDVTYREAEVAEQKYIIHWWKRAENNGIGDSYIERAVREREVWVCCKADKPRFIYGFVCGIRKSRHEIIVDYIFIRNQCRHYKWAFNLLRAAFDYNHLDDVILATYWNATAEHFSYKYPGAIEESFEDVLPYSI